MLELSYILREPILNPKQEVLGYSLSLKESGADPLQQAAQESMLVEFIATQLNRAESGWLLGSNKVFIAAGASLIRSGDLVAVPPENVVLRVKATDLDDPEVLSSLEGLKTDGFEIILTGGSNAADYVNAINLADALEIDLAGSPPAQHAQVLGAVKQTGKQLFIAGIEHWPDFDACAALGANSRIGVTYLESRPDRSGKGLNPAQTMILQLMDMVRKNADVRQLEGVLKRDAALSYKLLRYINSAGFGLGAEIQSLRHAVTMLGYSPLYRWLSLLLASASSGGFSPILMLTAVVRGRFAELLGKGFLPKTEAENLFVAGMFSLLDRLLGVPMEEVLESVQLSEPITQALLGRDGMYGPFLSLAESAEQGNGDVKTLAESLFISPLQVNEAHLAALAWAQNLKL